MTNIRVRPVRPGDEIQTANRRTLEGALKLHYHILRHLDDCAHEEMLRIMKNGKATDKTLRRLIRERDTAQEIFLLYIAEQIRRNTATSATQ